MKKALSTLAVTAVITGTILLTVGIANANAGCTINLKKKTATAKTYYTPSGESIGVKQLLKLKSQCSFNVSMMSIAELHEFKIKALKTKLKKLSKSPSTIDLGGL